MKNIGNNSRDLKLTGSKNFMESKSLGNQRFLFQQNFMMSSEQMIAPGGTTTCMGCTCTSCCC